MHRTLAAGLAAAAVATATTAFAEPLKIGFVYNSPIGDGGWTYQHDQGRLALEAALGDAVETSYVESVAEGDAARVMRQMVENGAGLVFATSFGFMNPMAEVAASYPDAVFEHATGYTLLDNMGVYHARAYEARYLSGIAAGSVSQSGVAGFIASFPIPEVIRGINAFTLGMRSVNPEATVKVIWISSWYDPGKETEAAQALIAQGADVISQFTDSPAPTIAAQEAGVWSISVGSDRSSYGPDAHLTSVVYNWAGFYEETARAVIDGTWQSANVWGGFDRGMIELAPLHAGVPDDARALIEDRRAAIAAGTAHPFAGPVADQDGTVRIAAGAVADDGMLLGMDWYVEGVDDRLPN
ncbi:MAG: BMP family ABC transporter substrate-binding protein [Alphaproteobacteria bacterium]